MRMNKIFNILIVLLFMSIVPIGVQAGELCDCYGSCTFIYPREVSTRIKREVKIRDGYDPYDKLEIDHKLPLCLGGTNNKDNLRALAKEQHKLKTEHDILLLYYVENCYMTVEEAQKEALGFKINKFELPINF